MLMFKRLQSEVKRATQEALPEGVLSLGPKGDNLVEWEATISGAPESPYEGGVFKVQTNIGDSYPLSPPNVKFLTRVYHPNISSSGFICISILKKGVEGCWSPATTLPMLMVAIRSLLMDPNTDDPIVPSIAAEVSTSPDTFRHKAKKWTEKYAM